MAMIAGMVVIVIVIVVMVVVSVVIGRMDVVVVPMITVRRTVSGCAFYRRPPATFRPVIGDNGQRLSKDLPPGTIRSIIKDDVIGLLPIGRNES
jgi:hypothetical protein